MTQRIGFLGGSFDPIHLGHLIIAQDAYEQMNLDAVYFVPTAIAPLKEKGPHVTDADRIRMIEAAIQKQTHLRLLDWELKQGGTSYTIDTVQYLTEAFAEDELFWIIGADQVAQLDRWYQIDELISQIEFICLERPGAQRKIPDGLDESRLNWVRSHTMDVSSSEIRKRIEESLNVAFFLPESVLLYIKESKIYQ